jgi:hypothetical protein
LKSLAQLLWERSNVFQHVQFIVTIIETAEIG